MADLMTALRNADAAGDTEAAIRIAAMIQAQQGPSQPASAEQPGMLDQLGHQLGLTGRYALEGAGNLAGVVTDPMGYFIPGYEKTGAAASRLADAVGLPKPQGKLENVVAGASKALVGTGLTAGIGPALGAVELGAQPLIQAVSSALGGGVQEATDSPVLGALASLAPGAKALGSMTARGLARGADPSKMQENIQAFEQAGTTPTVGQASQGGIAQGLESLLAKLPGSSGVMGRNAARQAEQVGGKVGGMADTLSPGSDPTSAGEAIQRGIAGEGGFVDQFKQKASQLYDAVDKHMPSDTAVPMRSTASFLASATTPTAGAEATSSILTNPKLAQIAQAVTSDTAASGAMPYQAVKALRTQVGSMLADSGLTSDVPRAQLKQLYGSLSDDLRTATNAAGPEAAKANNTAENFYRQGMDQIGKVESVVQRAGGPEKIFQAATAGTREGATTLGNVMATLKPEESKVVASAVMRRMGKANPGQQNDVGDVFSTQTFLSNWNGMSPQAKQILFDRLPGDFRTNMDQIAKTASMIKDSGKVVPNASGTSPGLAQIGAATAVGGAIFGGHPAAAVPVLAALGTTNLSAKLMTNPTFVKWLARNTTAPIGVLPAQLGYLDQLGQKQNDPDLTDAANQLSATLGQTQ